MTTDPDPIRRRKLSDDVEERLLALIQNGGLKPGDTLSSERELMTSYRVGRPAIREAMQNLQRMGLVEIRHGERPRVVQPSMDAMVGQLTQTMRHLLAHSETSLGHLKEARATFEAEMARIAAHQRNEEDVVGLRALLAQHQRSGQGSEKFLEYDGIFHRRIAAISGNPIFESLSFALFSWLTHFHADLVRKPGLEKLTLAEHQAIVDAIEAGDAVAAGQKMADHLNRANELYHQDNYKRTR
ncbi:MAG: transcriptional regulator NanR [Alphaproteobacteria bacterium]|nr:transcriptional regulator NanR [Alphaproteobacteria bacterium]